MNYLSLVFALFKSIFLRNQSLSNVRWFYAKNFKIGEGNLYLTENQLSRNEIWYAEDNHIYMCHICAKGILDSNFNEAVIDTKHHFFKILPQISHIFHKNHIFLGIIGIF